MINDKMVEDQMNSRIPFITRRLESSSYVSTSREMHRMYGEGDNNDR